MGDFYHNSKWQLWAPAGTMAINTVLGGDGSPSDRLVISGGAATGNTTVHVTNVGGRERKRRQRHSGGERDQWGDDRSRGVRPSRWRTPGGAFDYNLFRGGVSGSSANDWFLRSDFVAPPIVPPVTPPVTPPVVPLPIPPVPH